MVYVQYLQKDLSRVLGDRGVVILDGRNSMSTWLQDAVKFNGFRRPVFDAFQIFKGESFTRSKAITQAIAL